MHILRTVVFLCVCGGGRGKSLQRKKNRKFIATFLHFFLFAYPLTSCHYFTYFLPSIKFEPNERRVQLKMQLLHTYSLPSICPFSHKKKRRYNWMQSLGFVWLYLICWNLNPQVISKAVSMNSHRAIFVLIFDECVWRKSSFHQYSARER